MRGQQYGLPPECELAKQLHYLHSIPGVEIAGRLIGKNDRGPVDRSASDRNTLGLSAGQLIRVASCLSLKSDRLERSRYTVKDLKAPVSLKDKRDTDILRDSHCWQKVEELKHRTNTSSTQQSHRRIAQCRRCLTFNGDDSRSRTIDTTNKSK